MLAKKLALGLAVALILPLSIQYGVKAFNPRVDRDEYITDYWEKYNVATEEEKEIMRNESSTFDKYDAYQDKLFQKRHFYTAISIGITAIIIGSLLSVQAIGAGLMFGGIFSVMNVFYMSWYHIPDWVRFLTLVLGLIVIVYIGYAKMKDNPNKGNSHESA